MSTPWAIVPVKTLAGAKQRLAGVLPLEARRRLMLVMLDEVLGTLAGGEAIGPVLVVTPDARVADLAQARGARVLSEPRAQGHSAAVAAGFAHAAANGGHQAFTVPADAPCLTRGELAILMAAGVGAIPRMALVPSRDGDGTNGVLAAPPDVFVPCFGSGSFARHLAQARARGLQCRVLHLAGLAMDIDEPQDLRDLMTRKEDDPRYAFLKSEYASSGAPAARARRA